MKNKTQNRRNYSVPPRRFINFPPHIWPKKWRNSWHCKKRSFLSIFHLFWSNFQCFYFYKFELIIWGHIWNIWNVFLAAETTFLEIFCQKMCKKCHKFSQKSGGGGVDKSSHDGIFFVFLYVLWAKIPEFLNWRFLILM